MIIDCHVHLNIPESVYDRREVERCLALADRAGIDRLVYLFNLAESDVDPSPESVRRSNDLGMEVATRHVDRFDAFCYLNPAHDVNELCDEMDRCVVDGPCVGIKLWISVPADDARLDPIMIRARDLGVPVLHHAWYKANGQIYNESTPAQIAHLARRHPDVPIIMAHLSGAGLRGVLDVRDCPNVLIDTSGGQPVAGLVEYALEQLGPERVVYGSDWPIRDFAVQRARVDGADLTPEARQLVMGGNLARLLERRS